MALLTDVLFLDKRGLASFLFVCLFLFFSSQEAALFFLITSQVQAQHFDSSLASVLSQRNWITRLRMLRGCNICPLWVKPLKRFPSRRIWKKHGRIYFHQIHPISRAHYGFSESTGCCCFFCIFFMY